MYKIILLYESLQIISVVIIIVLNIIALNFSIDLECSRAFKVCVHLFGCGYQ